MRDIHSFEPLWGVWKIDKLLGAGSYGSVYRAVRHEHGVEYRSAIKHISIPMSETELQTIYDEGYVPDENSIRMYYDQLLGSLMQEIQFMYRLRGNTNIVAYEDHLIIPKKDMPGYDIFIRMELLRGLNDIMRTEPMTAAEVCKLGIDICRALELLEKEKIVHRDIKPANILRNSMGDYKLGDFGVARQLEHTHTVMSKKGTFVYMVPEVYKGKEADARADIYSLGLVMHRLLNNNKPPFVPTDAAGIITYIQYEEALGRRMRGETIPAPIMADAALAEIIGIACAYDPEDRFQTAASFRMALENYLKNELHSASSMGRNIPDGPKELPEILPVYHMPEPPTEKLFGGTVKGNNSQPQPEPKTEVQPEPKPKTEAENEPEPKKNGKIKRTLIVVGAAAAVIIALLAAYCDSYAKKIGVASKDAITAAFGSAEQQCALGDKYYSDENYEEAVKWYTLAAEQGSTNAQTNLGVCYEYGQGVEQDYEEAVKWYTLAAEQGDETAQTNLGVCYEYGQGVELDYEESVKWYTLAAEQGYASAQTNLGYCYEYGQGIEQDYEEAAKWYTLAAEQGYAGAQTNLGYCYQYGLGIEQDYEEAVKWYTLAAEQGHARAQNNLGVMYKSGQGVEQDYEKAIRWYTLAAEQGYARAQTNLGYCYEYGQGVEQDYEEAVKWYTLAAEQGDAWGQANLGICYENGQGTEQDYEEAAKWYTLAAEQEFALSQVRLGFCYEDGIGVEQDYEEAAKWYTLAAEQGDELGQCCLGLLYYDGKGVEKDREKAKALFEQAAASGYEWAEEFLKEYY